MEARREVNLKIAIFKVEDWERKAFEELADDHQIVYTDEPLRAETAAAFRDVQVIDVHALRALSSGRLAAAGLDVLPEEPVIREKPELLHSVIHRDHDLETLLVDPVLLRLRNVVITPHSTFNTREAVARILETTRENMEAFVGGEPQNRVTPSGNGGRT